MKTLGGNGDVRNARRLIRVGIVSLILATLLLGLLLLMLPRAIHAQPQTVTAGARVEWYYDDADLAVGPIALFLVCLDQQPTAACVRVAATTGGVPDAIVTTRKWWRWPLPPLLAGSHTVAVQACTADAAACSSGVTLAFRFGVLADVGGARVVGGGG